jgi:putative sterol carrier protein
MAMAPSEFMHHLDEQLKSDPSRTEGVNGVFQFVIEGDAGGSWWIEADDGTGAVHAGAQEQPTVTVRMPDEVFVRLGTKELDGAEAYMDGLMTVEGDQSKVMYLPQIFGE